MIDGLTDSSASIAECFALKDSRIKVFYKENGGISSARNFGLSKIKGDWIFFLDGDDCLYSKCLENLIIAASNYTDADIIQCKTYRGEKFINKIDIVKNIMYKVYNKMQIIDDFIDYNIMNCTVWGKFYRASKYKDLRFNDSCYVLEDVEYLSRAIQVFDGKFIDINNGGVFL